MSSTIEMILKRLSNDFIKSKFYSLHNANKDIFKNDNIIDISQLFSKIKEDLGIIIQKSQINDILDITLNEKDIENYYMNIRDNIASLNKFIDVKNFEEKVINIENIYKKRIKLLMENIKASLLYDYIFYTVIPEKKFRECLKLYKDEI